MTLYENMSEVQVSRDIRYRGYESTDLGFLYPSLQTVFEFSSSETPNEIFAIP